MEMLLLMQAGGDLFGLLIKLVVFIIVAGLIFWAVRKLLAAFGVGEPINTVVIVIVVLIIVFAALKTFMGGGLGL
jgi:hypothetical protein